MEYIKIGCLILFVITLVMTLVYIYRHLYWQKLLSTKKNHFNKKENAQYHSSIPIPKQLLSFSMIFLVCFVLVPEVTTKDINSIPYSITNQPNTGGTLNNGGSKISGNGIMENQMQTPKAASVMKTESSLYTTDDLIVLWDNFADVNFVKSLVVINNMNEPVDQTKIQELIQTTSIAESDNTMKSYDYIVDIIDYADNQYTFAIENVKSDNHNVVFLSNADVTFETTER